MRISSSSAVWNSWPRLPRSSTPLKRCSSPRRKRAVRWRRASAPRMCALLRKKFPGVPIVAYVNTYADVKAEVDICCTSGNAKAVVESLDSDTIIFAAGPLSGTERRQRGPARRSSFRVEKVTRSSCPRNPKDYDFIGWHGKM